MQDGVRGAELPQGQLPFSGRMGSRWYPGSIAGCRLPGCSSSPTFRPAKPWQVRLTSSFFVPLLPIAKLSKAWYAYARCAENGEGRVSKVGELPSKPRQIKRMWLCGENF